MIFKDKILNYVKAAYPCVIVPSTEEDRVLVDVGAAASEAGFRFFSWTETEGVFDRNNNQYVPPVDTARGDKPEPSDPFSMLDAMDKLPEKSVLLAMDFHMHMGTAQQPAPPMLIRRIKDSLALGKNSGRRLIIVGAQCYLPPELEKEITICEMPLPGREELDQVVTSVAKAAEQDIGDDVDLIKGKREFIVDSLMGLGVQAAEDALSLAYIETGKEAFDPEILKREKCAAIKQTGLLEVVDNHISLEDIGGLDLLKADLQLKRNLFSEEARAYGLETPAPVLLVGQPGTGKSLAAQALRAIMDKLLVRIEAGQLYGSLVGETEGNWRKAFGTAKALGKCIVWVDEVDGLFAGSSGTSTDGGTSQRLIKCILQDLQLNRDGLMFIFTANDIDALPDPLIDRCDVWSVDLPTAAEREEIWKIHIAKRKRDPERFRVSELAKNTEGFSGRQIEQAWLKTMMVAFGDGQREPNAEDVVGVVKDITPTSVLMADAIERRRKRLANRAKPASSQQESNKDGKRKF
jgi:SpoVK/Ycf46/Vps4 family AAA+-type ATPase